MPIATSRTASPTLSWASVARTTIWTPCGSSSPGATTTASATRRPPDRFTGDEQRGNTLPVPEHASLVERWFEDLFTLGDLDELVTPDFRATVWAAMAASTSPTASRASGSGCDGTSQ